MLYKIDKLFKVSEGFWYPWIYKRSKKCASWTLLLRFHCQTARGRCTCTWTSLSEFTEWYMVTLAKTKCTGIAVFSYYITRKNKKGQMHLFTNNVRATKESINMFLPSSVPSKYISVSFRSTILSPYSSYKNGASSFRLNSNCQFCSSSSSQ